MKLAHPDTAKRDAEIAARRKPYLKGPVLKPK